MFEEVKIAPSILSADFMNMQHEVLSLEKAGADLIHIDVMDGHFVPNLTIGVPVTEQLSAIATIPLDVHLMISNPLVQIPWFLKANPHLITVHWEALDEQNNEVERAIEMIHEGGSKAGLALKPDAPIEVLDPYLESLDMILIMSVFPGFSGQSFIEGSDKRIADVARRCKQKNIAPLIQVDGGIGIDTAALVGSAGADVLVAGNAVFKSSNLADAIKDIRDSATHAQNNVKGGSVD